MIRILVFEPGKDPYVTEVENTLQAMQGVVDGFIEIVFPFWDDPVLICNEEGKIRNLPVNRVIQNEFGWKLDTIHGTFFICNSDEEDGLTSITDEQIAFFKEEFKDPAKPIDADRVIKFQTGRFRR